ncbi:hypothetical protein LINGRAHAP2_LOCUS10372 [Linum grandiflorum]
MKGEQQETNRSDDGNGRGERVVADISQGKPDVGDVIWTKLSGRLWWPALVVEEDNGSSRYKRRRRSDRDVLVRLYGSSKQHSIYTDVDSNMKISAFGSCLQILEQNNGSCHEIFWKSLRKELPHLEPDSLEGCSSTGKGTRGKADFSKRNKSNRNEVKEGTTTSNDDKVTASMKQKNTPQKKKAKADESAEDRRPVQQVEGGEQTPRRVKVMQTLGLVPPSGSPF